MAYGGGLPPHMHNPLVLQATASLAKERSRKSGLASMPTLALIIVLPLVLGFRMLRFIYRKATGWTPPLVPQSERMTRAKIRAITDDICSGSGGEAADDGSCPVCSKPAPASGGKLLTHQR